MCQSLWRCYNIGLLKLETLIFKIFFHNEQVQFLSSELQKTIYIVTGINILFNTFINQLFDHAQII